MTTDFNKLTRYECALVGMIVLGLAIIGFEIFSSLPNSAQASIKQGMAVLDIHESVVEQSYQMAMLLDVADDIFPAFNESISQTFAIDEELLVFYDFSLSTMESVKSYALEITSHQAVAFESPGAGTVLGITSDESTAGGHENATTDTEEEFFYTFETPTMEYVKTLLPTVSFK
jgi:hypothetical protein